MATQSETSDGTTLGDSVCGDGQVEGTEVCDDAENDGSYGGCSPDCSAFGPFCGDGEMDRPEEACDDGNDADGDGCNNNCAVSGSVVWERTFSSAEEASWDSVRDVASQSNGDALAVIRTQLGDGTNRVGVHRYSALGDTVRSVPVSNTAPEQVAADANILPDGSYAIGFRGVMVGSDASIRRLDSEHSELWEASLPGLPNLQVAAMADGHVFHTESAFLSPAFLVRRSSTGAVVWRNRFAGEGNSVAYDVSVAPNGGLFAAGYDPVLEESTVQSRSTAGGVLWSSNVGNPQAELSISADTNDGVAVCWGQGDGLFAMRFGTEGQLLWSGDYVFPTGTLAECNDLVVREFGGVVAIGSQYQDSNQEILVVRFSDAGELRWARSFSGEAGGSDRGSSIDETADGRLLVGGEINNVGSDLHGWIAMLEP